MRSDLASISSGMRREIEHGRRRDCRPCESRSGNRDGLRSRVAVHDDRSALPTRISPRESIFPGGKRENRAERSRSDSERETARIKYGRRHTITSYVNRRPGNRDGLRINPARFAIYHDYSGIPGIYIFSYSVFPAERRDRVCNASAQRRGLAGANRGESRSRAFNPAQLTIHETRAIFYTVLTTHVHAYNSRLSDKGRGKRGMICRRFRTRHPHEINMAATQSY